MSSRRKDLREITGEKVSHAGLWLDKYITNQSREETESRRQLVAKVATIPISAAYKIYYQHWEKTLTSYGAQTRKAEVKGHMVVGLGAESVLETSVALHRTYGVPYIPGSALKGLAASYVEQQLKNDDAWKKEGEAYKVIFGDTTTAGYVTFFDALYIPGTGTNGQPLHPDVITVHHPNYYQGAKNKEVPPADWDSPTPIPFLSATGTYLIALAAPEIQQPAEWLDTTFTILGEALETMGIGAKTSSGYGRMKLEISEPYIRPNILSPREGQKLAGIVLDPNKDQEAAKRLQSGEASACLKYKDRELPTKMLLIRRFVFLFEKRHREPAQFGYVDHN